ncbi:MAG TPA: hypothetical protein VE868_00350 [Balneolaceae bacterium]|nr:hypothetical protein [Balneolaceae bacterium]
MKSMFTLDEVGEMLDMTVEEVEEEIDEGYLNYSFEEGEKKITLYDLEKYMGPEQTRQITNDYLGKN